MKARSFFVFFCALKGGPFSRRSQLTETGDLLYFQRRLPVPVVLLFLGVRMGWEWFLLKWTSCFFPPSSMEVLVCFSQKISTGGFSWILHCQLKWIIGYNHIRSSHPPHRWPPNHGSNAKQGSFGGSWILGERNESLWAYDVRGRMVDFPWYHGLFSPPILCDGDLTTG